MVPRYWLVTGYIPLNSSYNAMQVFLEHGTQPKHVWQPPYDHGKFLKHMWINRYSEGTAVIIDGKDSPRYRGLATANSSDIKVVAGPVNPLPKTTLIHPPAEILNFIP